LKQVLDKEGPKGFAKAVRENRGLLITDTTWRDAHQSLLATRLRTIDILKIAPATAHVMSNAYSLENWGGATFDTALRFLHECPWERLDRMRELVPNIPFQMLLRGANGVGYTSYPDNVIFKFAREAVRHGMDVFRIFDSLNDFDNLCLGLEAVGEAGGVVEGAVCYTGDVCNPNDKYNLDYYLELVAKLKKKGVHVLAVKDMAGLLYPRAARTLIGALRKEFPTLPIHVHTHDTAGTGVASMLAAHEAGADAVDAALDAMSGLTSQPAMGAIVQNVARTPEDTGIVLDDLQELNTYWQGVRDLYGPWESGQKSAGSDVYGNQIPGGQYTNLMVQARSLGVGGAQNWSQIKKAYREANLLLGDIVKVTPSSKVVGDLAQFMVVNNLDYNGVLAKASELNFPSSVIDYLQGGLGHPPFGYLEPFRSQVLKNLPRYKGRPGAEMPPLDFDKLRKDLEGKYGKGKISEVDLCSASQYPAVFAEYKAATAKYGPLTNLPTRQFLAPMLPGQQVTFNIDNTKVNVQMGEIEDFDKERGVYYVDYKLNNSPVCVSVAPTTAAAKQQPWIKQGQGGKVVAAAATPERKKAQTGVSGHVGCPMPGAVMNVYVKAGDSVKKGDKVALLTAMKMETPVAASCDGVVKEVLIKPGEEVLRGDLIVDITPK
jgi:pyruvate carboxylase